MKIVCDACSAKYSIADDKVKGKVFKIRCKKCSNIIVVRGTAGAGGADEPAPAQFDQKDTRVYDYGYDDAGAPAGAPAPTGADADAVWHVVVDQEQVGPLTVGEVQEKFSAGQIDADTYVWREGFADWQPLATVDAFAHFASGGGGGGSSGADAVSSMFGAPAGDDGGTVRSNPDDLFAARSGGTAQRDDEGDSGDLFGARSAAPAAAASAPRAEAGGGSKLRGERNENSVLFSLGNLAALASDAPRASASSSSSSSSSSGGGAAQHGGGEGSGLIDIRSMASAYLGDKPGAAKKQQSNVGSIDDLPVFSAAAFSEPAVIMPGPVHRQSNKTMMMLIGGVAALAVITLGLVLFIVLGDKNEGAAPPPAVAAGETKTGDDKAVDTSAKTGGDTTGTAADPTGTGGDGTGTGTAAAAATPTDDEDEKPATGTTATEDDKKSDSKKSDSKKSDSKRDDRRSSSSSSDKKPEEKKPEPASSGGCMDEVGCLLADKPPSCCSKYSKGKKTTEKKPAGNGGNGGGGGDLPESLDSDMVKEGVGKVKSRIFACGDKYPSAKGTLKLSVKVSSGGSVTSVDVVNTPDAGLGNCAKSAMRGAKFGKTQRGGSFKYPFNF